MPLKHMVFYCVSVPGWSEECTLYWSKIKVENIFNQEIHLFFEGGILTGQSVLRWLRRFGSDGWQNNSIALLILLGVFYDKSFTICGNWIWSHYRFGNYFLNRRWCWSWLFCRSRFKRSRLNEKNRKVPHCPDFEKKIDVSISTDY